MEQEFLAYLKKENLDLEFTQEEYAFCRDLIAYRLKAAFASNLFGLAESYQVSNEYNAPLKRAVQLLQSKEYNKYNLAKP
jgi:hypothetical protein